MSVIVVGIDGSPGSVAALQWAVDEARLRDATLRVVHAWESPYGHGGEIARAAAETTRGPLQQAAENTMDATLREIAGLDGVAVERSVVESSPVRALMAAADDADADLLVVGSRGHSGFAGLLLGSVSQKLALHAPGPVVIVR